MRMNRIISTTVGTALALGGCSAGQESQEYLEPVPVLYSQEIACSSLAAFKIGEFAYEVTPIFSANPGPRQEKISQEMVNWGTPSEDATQMHRGQEISTPFIYDFSNIAQKLGAQTFHVTAFAITTDESGVSRFVPAGEGCSMDIKIVPNKPATTIEAALR